MLEKWKIQDGHPGVCSGPWQWIKTNGPLLNSFNPATGEKIASIMTGDEASLENLLQQAKAISNEWKSVPAPKRGALIREMGLRLRENKTLLAELITLEMGKPLEEAQGEVQEMIDMADLAVGQSRMLYGVTMVSEREAHRLFEQWHPLGIVLVMTSFNFPMAVWAWNAFLALVCGNVVIWKPSSKVPLCAIAVQTICNEVLVDLAYPPVSMLFITADHALTKKMVEAQAIGLVSFTGSTQVGRQIYQWVGARLGKCLLELGGNNALIVDESADLNLAIRAILFGALGTAGQRCTSTRRLIVHEKVYDKVLALLLQAYGSVKARHFMGPLIDEQAVKIYEDTVLKAQAEGGKVVFGGKRLEGMGYYVEPCLIEIAANAPIVQFESFVPILYLFKASSFEEALDWQNQSHYGLSSALFTQDLRHLETFLSSQGSDCGLANVNAGTSGAEIGAAFGGEKNTGGGREAGSDAWKAYMWRQACVINGGKALPLSQGIVLSVEGESDV